MKQEILKAISDIKKLEQKIKVLERMLKDCKKLSDYEIQEMTRIERERQVNPADKNSELIKVNTYLFLDEYYTNIYTLINDYKKDLMYLKNNIKNDL